MIVEDVSRAFEVLCSVERRVAALGPQQIIEIDMSTAQSLLDTGTYGSSFGLNAGAHFRRELGEGCLHLNVVAGHGFLHRDLWDPRRHPFLHFFEVPELWVPATIGLALAAAGGEEAQPTLRRPIRLRRRN